MPTLHVVMPVYNEGPTLQEILSRVLNAPLPSGWQMTVTMVDDGSQAQAAEAARQLVMRAAETGARVGFLSHPVNRGKGAALMTGFDAVLAGANAGAASASSASPAAAQPDAVLVQDADLEYDPADYPALIAALEASRASGQPTAVFGNRWGTGSHRAGTYRRVHAAANRTLTAFSNVLTGLRVRDMECCYKLIPVPLLRQIRPWLSEERFGIEPQFAAALARVGAAVVEVPVRYDPRTYDEGKKIRWTDGVQAFMIIARERARRVPPKKRGETGKSAP